MRDDNGNTGIREFSNIDLDNQNSSNLEISDDDSRSTIYTNYHSSDCSDSDSDLESSSSGDDGRPNASTDTATEPLYNGSHVSTDLAVMTILQYYVDNNLSKQGLNNLLQLLDTLLPSPNNLPKSKYHLDKFINTYSPPVEHVRHNYCMACNFYIGDNSMDVDDDLTQSDTFHCPVCSCNTKKGFFITYNLSDLLRNFLEAADGKKSILLQDEMRDQNISNQPHMHSSISDVSDGYCHSYLRRDLKLKSTDLTLIWNTDGVPVFKSSNAQLWPIQFSIAEIPPQMRHNSILVCGLWFGHEKPDMNTFLR